MASLKRTARNLRAKKENMDRITDGVLKLSVTIGYLATDVGKQEMALVEKLLQDHCGAGVVAMERGDLEQHLHFQMVCRARVNLAKSFGVLVQKYLGWHGEKNMSPAGKVMCKVLTNRLIHTWKGMIGYCLKDSRTTHSEVAMHNILDEEVIAGKTLHNIYGKVDLKSRVIITNKNIGERAYVWFKFKEKRQMTASFLSTLTDMVQSAMFIPAGFWIIPHGGQGMDQKTMNSYWRCLTDPTNVTKSEVGDVFVNKRQFFKNRYTDEEEEVSKDEKEDEESLGNNVQARSTRKEGEDIGPDPPQAIKRIPRSLAVAPLGSNVSKRTKVKQEVSWRIIGSTVRKKLFSKVAKVRWPRKSVRFLGGLLPDFIPPKDWAALPNNICLPMKDVLSEQQAANVEIGEDEFWDVVANPLDLNCGTEKICNTIGASKTCNVGVVAGKGSVAVVAEKGPGETSSVGVVSLKEPVVVVKEPVVEPVLLSSDSEDDTPARKKRRTIDLSSEDGTLPAGVYEDRRPSSPGHYFAGPDKVSLVKVKREFACNYFKCASEYPGECACVR